MCLTYFLLNVQVLSLGMSDESGTSIDFGLGDEVAFRRAAETMSDFETNPSVSSTIVRNIQSIGHPQFSMILMGLADAKDSVRKGAGVIFVADLSSLRSISPKKG